MIFAGLAWFAVDHPALAKSEFQVPPAGRVSLPRQFCDSLQRRIGQKRAGVPLLLQRGLYFFGGDVDVGQEIGVLAALAVIGLFGGHPQQAADERKVEVQQEGSVKEQEIFAAALGVAGELQTAEAKVCVAAHGDFGAGSRQPAAG